MSAIYEAPQSHRGKMFKSQFILRQQWEFEVTVSGEMKHKGKGRNVGKSTAFTK